MMENIQIEPILKKSVVQDAISKIKEMIDKEIFKYGEKLPPERELAKLLGISLPSLREALRALSVLGITEGRHGDGTYLRSSLSNWRNDPFSLLFSLRPSVHIDLLEARIGIEGMISELAAKKRTEEDLASMQLALEKMKSHMDRPNEYIKFEIEFHAVIIRSARNIILEDLMEKINKLLYESRKKTVEYLKDVYKESYLKHHRIYLSIKNGNAKEARESMTKHLLLVEKRIMKDTLNKVEKGNQETLMKGGEKLGVSM
jgi:GntR family transcriptional regulator, transcriptional repressor for pyruvate dehydrogenase complex